MPKKLKLSMPRVKPINRHQAGSLGDALLNSLSVGLEEAFDEEWGKVKKKLRREVYAYMSDCLDPCIRVVDASDGETWFEVSLQKLVTERIRDLSDADLVDALADEFTRQASRLKKRAKWLRRNGVAK